MGSAAYEERFSIPAEEQNAGRVVDYIFFRVEFHSTPGFFSDSNYLFSLKTFSFLLFFPYRNLPHQQLRFDCVLGQNDTERHDTFQPNWFPSIAQWCEKISGLL